MSFEGYEKIEFQVNGRYSIIVCPKKPLNGNPWIWKTEFFEAFNFAERALLDMGFHLAYHQVSDMYGCPESISMMKEFYDAAVGTYGLNSKPALFGFSRGGLYACNFALKYPEAVAALYLDAPVLDIKSWPGGLMSGVGAEREFNECLGLYGLDKTSVLDFKKNPVDRLDELLSLKMPVALVAGDSDEVVPYVENGKYLEELYKNNGGDLLCIVKPGCGHHPHSIPDPTPVTEFLMKKY